jgi:hypothetical protein
VYPTIPDLELIIQLGHPATKKIAPNYVTGFLKMALKQGFKTSPSKELLEGMLAPWTTNRPEIVYQELKAFLDSTEGLRVIRKQDSPSIYS